MLERILVPTDLTPSSNAIFPYAVTLAQAFNSKMYLIHVMHPDSIKEPERLTDFPRLSKFFAVGRNDPDLPPLKNSVTVAKVYRYHSDSEKVILSFAKQKEVDLICMASTTDGTRLAWWSAGAMMENVLKKAKCSVLCLNGRAIKEKDWKRPHFRNILLLVELNPQGAAPLLKVLPWVHTFNSVLHIFPLENEDAHRDPHENPLQGVAALNANHTNVLLFAEPQKRMRNLMNFVENTPIDLIVMPPRARAKLSTPLVSDVLARLLRITESPVLLLR